MLLDEKEMVNEGANINKSLLALTNCINILAERTPTQDAGGNGTQATSLTMSSGQNQLQASFVPYRNSKLTRILKDSLSSISSHRQTDITRY